jgi:beta-galactosidase
MYASPEECMEIISTKSHMPFLLCEYSHAMGNSSGNLKEYWELIYADNNFQGGFVWDWVDQGIQQPVPEEYLATASAETFFAYGGWWENRRGIQNDGNFCMNGLVAADRTPRPGLNTVKYFYRNIHVEQLAEENKLYRIINWHDFTNLKEYAYGRWELLEDGIPVLEGTLDDLDIDARQQMDVKLDLDQYPLNDHSEYTVVFTFFTKASTQYADKDHELAWDQFTLRKKPESAFQKGTSKKEISAMEKYRSVFISGENFTMVIDRIDGQIKEYYFKGQKIIESGPVPDFWRVPTDNDRGAVRGGNRNDPNLKIWENAGSWMSTDYKLTKLENAVRVHITGNLPMVDADYSMEYIVYGNGAVDITCVYNPGEKELPMLPRFGNLMVLSAGYENIRWFGHGPNPTYADRLVEKTGIFSSTVDKEWVDYSKPQENGYKTNTRWFSITNNDGLGLKVSGPQPLGIGLTHFSKQDMQQAEYSFQLTKHAGVFMNVDMGQMGVGGTTSWMNRAYPRKDYRIPNKAYSYTYRIEPVEE